MLNRWYAQQLHHTAIGLPFQPQPEGPVTFDTDESTTFAAFRILSTAYWMYGQQIFLLYEHFGGDMSEYQRVFLDGLRQQAEVIGSRASFARTRANDRSDGRAAAAQRPRPSSRSSSVVRPLGIDAGIPVIPAFGSAEIASAISSPGGPKGGPSP